MNATIGSSANSSPSQGKASGPIPLKFTGIMPPEGSDNWPAAGPSLHLQ